MKKICPRCNKLLILEEFNWKIKNVRRAAYCKTCSRLYIQEHYKNNKAYYIEKAKRRNNSLKSKEFEYIYRYFQSHPCIDCGESDIRVLEFDHKDRANKKDAVSILITRGIPFRKIVEEIGKCDVRCANCHRKKTANESHSWRVAFAPVG